MATEIETEDEDGGGKRLTPAQWAEIVERIELGTTTAADAAREYGVSAGAISKGLTKRGVTRGSRAHEVAAKAKAAALKAVEENALSIEEERQAKIRDTRTQTYEWSKMLSGQIVAVLAKAQKDGRPFADEFPNIKTLRAAILGLEAGQRQRLIALNADKDDGDTSDLPTLELRDLSEQRIKEIQGSDSDDGLIVPPVDDDVVTEV